jgi:hypothetical protein
VAVAGTTLTCGTAVEVVVVLVVGAEVVVDVVVGADVVLVVAVVVEVIVVVVVGDVLVLRGYDTVFSAP